MHFGFTKLAAALTVWSLLNAAVLHMAAQGNLCRHLFFYSRTVDL